MGAKLVICIVNQLCKGELPMFQDLTIIYSRIVYDYPPLKDEHNQVQITMVRKLID